LTEDKKLEGRGLGETKLKIENRGLLGVSSNDIGGNGKRVPPSRSEGKERNTSITKLRD
jgi:hypothetical protein